MCNIIGFLIIMLFTLFYVRVYILLTCREHFYDHNLSRRREIWAHKTGLTASFFIEGSVPRHGSQRLCICEGYWSCLFLSCVYWILGQFRQCFFFILSLKRTQLFTPQWEKGYKFVNKNVSSFFFHGNRDQIGQFNPICLVHLIQIDDYSYEVHENMFSGGHAVIVFCTLICNRLSRQWLPFWKTIEGTYNDAYQIFYG